MTSVGEKGKDSEASLNKKIYSRTALVHHEKQHPKQCSNIILQSHIKIVKFKYFMVFRYSQVSLKRLGKVERYIKASGYSQVSLKRML